MLLLVKFNVPVLWLTIALSAIGGVTAVASSVGVETLAQERTPEHVRGRVFGSLQASIWLSSLLGAVVGGVLGEVLSVLRRERRVGAGHALGRRRPARDPSSVGRTSYELVAIATRTYDVPAAPQRTASTAWA